MEAQAPGLRWRTTRAGKRPMWRASKAAIKANYPVKTVNLAPSRSMTSACSCNVASDCRQRCLIGFKVAANVR